MNGWKLSANTYLRYGNYLCIPSKLDIFKMFINLWTWIIFFLVKSSLNATHVYPMILGMKSILIFVNFMWIIAFSAHQKVETIVKSKLTESYNMFTKDNSTTYGKFLCRSIVEAGVFHSLQFLGEIPVLSQ